SAVAGPMANGVTNDGQALAGAIISGGVLTLSNSIVADNEAVGGMGGSTLTLPVYTDSSFGGGLNNAGIMNITGCWITGNRAIGGGKVPRPPAGGLRAAPPHDLKATLKHSPTQVTSHAPHAGPGRAS